MSKRIGVGGISLGWMGRLHARSYRALAERYRDLGAEVRLAAVAQPRVDPGQVDRHAEPGYSMRSDQVGGQGSRCESGADPPL